MPVSDQHLKYIENLKRWQLVSDCVKGSTAVKSRDNGKAYLPMSNPSNLSQANKDQYEAYKYRASFVNFTGHTRRGMSGMVFRKDMVCELPTQIEYLKDNANGGGLSLEQLSKDILGEVLEAGRYGLLVDYPDADSDLTKAQVEAMQLRANIFAYDAENIINWRTEIVGSLKKLSLVVLEEMQERVEDDGFGVKEVVTYRVLRMIDGVYTQQIYDEDEEMIAEFEPKQSDGSTWDEIPFIFVGAANNDEAVDDAPLYDMAEVNLKHYLDSADWQDSSYMVGQPTPVIAGLTQGWVDEVLKGQVLLGSRAAIPLPEGGVASLLQANPNQMPMEGMKVKEAQMLMIGARLIQDNGGQETAEAAKIRFAGQNSDLSSIVGNIENALKNCFMWVQNYMGGEGEATIELNRHFYDSHLDAQQVMALIQLADRGDISSNDIRDNLRKSGLISADKEDEEIDNENDLMGGGLQLETPQQDPQLTAILTKLSEAVTRQEYIPAANEQGQTDMFAQPSVTVEAPVVNVTLPEGLIQLPENMVTVTVESPEINVESPNVTIEGSEITPAPIVVNNNASDKIIDFVYNEQGKVIQGKINEE